MFPIRVKITESHQNGNLVTRKLISRKEYLQETDWKMYGKTVKANPYKWWQIWYLIAVPAYFIGLFAYRILKIKETKNTTIATFVGASICDALIAYAVAKFLDWL